MIVSAQKGRKRVSGARYPIRRALLMTELFKTVTPSGTTVILAPAAICSTLIFAGEFLMCGFYSLGTLTFTFSLLLCLVGGVIRA